MVKSYTSFRPNKQGLSITRRLSLAESKGKKQIIAKQYLSSKVKVPYNVQGIWHFKKLIVGGPTWKKTVKDIKVQRDFVINDQGEFVKRVDNGTLQVLRIREAKRLYKKATSVIYEVAPAAIVAGAVQTLSVDIHRVVQSELRPNMVTKIRLAFTGFQNFPLFLSPDTTQEQLLQMLTKQIDNNKGPVDYTVYLESIEFLHYPKETQGSCNNNKAGGKKIMFDSRTVRKLSYQSKNNNCLFACFNGAFGLKGSNCKPDNVRKKLDIPLKTPISISQVPLIYQVYQDDWSVTRGYQIFDHQHHLIQQSEVLGKNPARILLENSHYYGLIPADNQYCKNCKVSYVNSHTCTLTHSVKANYSADKIDGILPVYKQKDQPPITCDQVYVFNVVVKVNDEDDHLPVRVDLLLPDEQTKQLKPREFYDFLKGVPTKGILVANEASVYQSKHLIRMMEQIGEPIPSCDLFMARGKVMKLEICGFRVFDIQAYTRGWDKIPNTDLVALRNLFMRIANIIHKMTGKNIANFMSLHAVGYTDWMRTWIKHTRLGFENMKDPAKMDIVDQASYYARVYPLQHSYKSAEFGKSHQAVAESGDYLFSADVTSLYPAAMAGVDYLPQFAYPEGISRLVHDSEECFKAGKLGIYYIHFIPNQSIRHPILPSKTQKSSTKWTLMSHTGYYCSADVKRALENNYEVTFLKDKPSLVWDSKCFPFGSFVEKWKKIKEDGRASGDDVMEHIGKNILNALTGQLQQKNQNQYTKFIRSVEELRDAVSDAQGRLDAFEFVEDNLLTIQVSSPVSRHKTQKPKFLAVFLLAYSRDIMTHLMKVIDPSLQERIFTYTDTDNLVVDGMGHRKLVEAGFIHASKLGYLKNDYKDNSLIVEQICWGPRRKQIRCIKPTNELTGTKLTYCGIDGNQLNDECTQANMKSVKTNKDLSLTSTIITRRLSDRRWTGMVYQDNEWYPLKN